MQGIGSDGGAGEVHIGALEECAGGGLFVAFAGSCGHRYGRGGCAVVPVVFPLAAAAAGGVDEADDGAELAAEVLAVQRKGAGKRAFVLREPSGQQREHLFEINHRQQLAEGIVAGHAIDAGVFFPRQTQGAALALAQELRAADDVAHGAAAAEQAHADEGQEQGKRIAPAVDAARVVHLTEDVLEGAHLRHAQGAAHGGGILAGTAVVRKDGRTEQRAGVAVKRKDPQPLGPAVRLVEIGAMPAKAFSLAERDPVGGLVAGAVMRFQIGEGLGQQRLIAVCLVPLRGKCAQGRSEHLGGHVGLACFFQNQQARVVDDESESARARHAIPADPCIAVLEVKGACGPDQHGHRLAVCRAAHDLPESPPRRVAGAQ